MLQDEIDQVEELVVEDLPVHNKLCVILTHHIFDGFWNEVQNLFPFNLLACLLSLALRRFTCRVSDFYFDRRFSLAFF
jgi:hypothetical protein